MDYTPIPTETKTINVTGKVFYASRRRRIDLKKPIRDLFEESLKPIHYHMEVGMSKEAIIERVNSLSITRVTPILLYFSQKKEDKDDEMS